MSEEPWFSFRLPEDATDKKGYAHLIASNGRHYRLKFRTSVRKRVARTPHQAAVERRRRRLDGRQRAQFHTSLKLIERQAQIDELEAILEEMAAAGEIQKNPDGTYQANLATRMASRRDRMRGGAS
jgi:hypothetical protein